MVQPRTPDQEVLYSKIRQHLAELDTKYGFVRRLSRENRWSESFARETVAEYAKFLFIAREGGHPISPSPIIDKVWHLHLCHTETYWQALCRDILQMDLHHAPHTGDPWDSANFARWSNQTLDSYRHFFGVPSMIWAQTGSGQFAYNASVVAWGVAIGSVILGSLTGQWEFAIAITFVALFMGAILSVAAREPLRLSRRQAGFGCGSAASCGGGGTGGEGIGAFSHGHGSGHGAGGHDGGDHGGGHGCGGGGHSCGGGGGH